MRACGVHASRRRDAVARADGVGESKGNRGTKGFIEYTSNVKKIVICEVVFWSCMRIGMSLNERGKNNKRIWDLR